jgi:uncharacterized damage-inducible protein DinB
MTTTAPLALDNIHYLAQALDLLEALDDESYRKPFPPFFTSGVGGHLRHNLDHYRSFLDGLGTWKIDYDARERDTRMETDRALAAQLVRDLIDQLRSVSEADTEIPVLVKMDSDAEDEAPVTWRRSTVGRELQFLVSHTVHHYALIAVQARLHGVDPGEDFGVAPSTVRYLRTKLACVPQLG